MLLKVFPMVYVDLKELHMTTIIIDQVLDCSGLLCPLPVVKATKAIKQMQIGQVLKMIATDPGAPPDMAAWSRQTGHEILEQSADGNKFIFFIKRVK
jgi:tRNA 2-thiouridine synthesizing protein A